MEEDTHKDSAGHAQGGSEENQAGSEGKPRATAASDGEQEVQTERTEPRVPKNVSEEKN